MRRSHLAPREYTRGNGLERAERLVVSESNDELEPMAPGVFTGG